MTRLKEMIRTYVVELLVVLTFSGVTGFVAMSKAWAVQEQRVEDLERRIEQLRQENKEDHKMIMDILLKREK